MGNPVKIDPAALATLDALREKCRHVVDKIDAAQEAHVAGRRRKCFQLLPCFKGAPPTKDTAIPADVKAAPSRGAGLVERVPDGVDAKGQPKSKVVTTPDPTWADVLKGDDPALPCDVRVDEYDGPNGVGYIVTYTATLDGVTYTASEDRGPEGGMGREWQVVCKEKA